MHPIMVLGLLTKIIGNSTGALWRVDGRGDNCQQARPTREFLLFFGARHVLILVGAQLAMHVHLGLQLAESTRRRREFLTRRRIGLCSQCFLTNFPDLRGRAAPDVLLGYFDCFLLSCHIILVCASLIAGEVMIRHCRIESSANVKLVFSGGRRGQNNRVQVNAPESACRVIHALRGACLTQSVNSPVLLPCVGLIQAGDLPKSGNRQNKCEILFGARINVWQCPLLPRKAGRQCYKHRRPAAIPDRERSSAGRSHNMGRFQAIPDYEHRLIGREKCS